MFIILDLFGQVRVNSDRFEVFLSHSDLFAHLDSFRVHTAVLGQTICLLRAQYECIFMFIFDIENMEANRL